MRSAVTIVLFAALLLLVAATGSYGQYYGYYPYYYGPAPGYVPYSQPEPYYGGNPYYYRLRPNPRVYRKWDRYNRALDLEQMERSPLNPEGNIEYMLRTF